MIVRENVVDSRDFEGSLGDLLRLVVNTIGHHEPLIDHARLIVKVLIIIVLASIA